jgi:hypothetical protein
VAVAQPTPPKPERVQQLVHTLPAIHQTKTRRDTMPDPCGGPHTHVIAPVSGGSGGPRP